MKKLVAVLVLMAWASLAHGQTVGQDGQSTRQVQQGMLQAGILSSDSTIKVLRMSSSGSAMISDESRDRDNWTTYPLAINDTTTVGSAVPSVLANMGVSFTAESTTVMASGAYKKFVLMFKVDPAAGDTSTLIRYAVQVRGHLTQTADSTNTFVWHQWGAAPTTGSAVDSLGQYIAVGFSGGSWNIPVSGEFILEFNPKLGRALGAAQAMTGPVGQMVTLIGPRGESFWAPYMSVRVRCLTGASKPRIQLSVAMGS